MDNRISIIANSIVDLKIGKTWNKTSLKMMSTEYIPTGKKHRYSNQWINYSLHFN